MKDNNCSACYGNTIPLNACNQPYNQSAINRMYPKKINAEIKVQQQPLYTQTPKPVYIQNNKKTANSKRTASDMPNQPVQQQMNQQINQLLEQQKQVNQQIGQLLERTGNKTQNVPQQDNLNMKPYDQKPMFEPNPSMGYADSFCNQGQCRGTYPVPFAQTCAVVPPAPVGSCYPHTSILQLISKILKWKYSGIDYNTLGYMFYNAFLLWYNPDQSIPYFVSDYTYAVLNSILVGNFATEEWNNFYPDDYYDKVIRDLKILQYRITDGDFRFQFNGQLCCYLVQSIPEPPENLVTPYIPNQSTQLPTQPPRGGLY